MKSLLALAALAAALSLPGATAAFRESDPHIVSVMPTLGISRAGGWVLYSNGKVNAIDGAPSSETLERVGWTTSPLSLQVLVAMAIGSLPPRGRSSPTALTLFRLADRARRWSYPRSSVPSSALRSCPSPCRPMATLLGSNGQRRRQRLPVPLRVRLAAASLNRKGPKVRKPLLALAALAALAAALSLPAVPASAARCPASVPR